MTPLKQQISLVPFSIEHTDGDGVLKIGQIRRSIIYILLIKDVLSVSLHSVN